MGENRSQSAAAFGRFLEWLDDGVDSRGESYLEMRRRLVTYFDRRNRPAPDDLADETFNRVARTLDETGAILITPPARYCYVIARFVLLEDLRRHQQTAVEHRRSGDVLPRLQGPGPEQDEEAATRERRFQCLEDCLQRLKPEQRDLIVEYYRDGGREKIERRRGLATRLGISMNALAIRACRIRDALEACVKSCCSGP